jgi:mono/diheme cytochrome c family protein
MRQDQLMAARPGRHLPEEQTMRNFAILAFAMLVLGATVEGSRGEEMPNLKDPAMISAGHALFLEKQCAHCHGEDGTGGVNLARRVLDAKGVFVSIADGREKNGIRMPAWREVMSDKEIWQATAYVLSICKSQD